MDDLALILEPGSPKPDAGIGRSIAARLGIHLADAVARVRYGGGILLDRAPAAAAESIAADLRALGVRARGVQPNFLELMPQGKNSNRLEITEEACYARLASGEDLVIPRRDLRAINIHAHAVPPGPRPEERLRKALETYFMETQLSPRARRILDWIEDSGKPPPRFILTVYAPDPVGPVRLEREEIDFSPLGDRKLTHSLENFLCLAEVLLEAFPDLINRERVRNFLDRPDPDAILYFKEEESQNFDRWIQAWIRLQDSMERGSIGTWLPEGDL